jgi:hypothetical protein
MTEAYQSDIFAAGVAAKTPSGGTRAFVALLYQIPFAGQFALLPNRNGGHTLSPVAQLCAKVIAVPAHAVLERVEPARAAFDNAGLCKVVDDLR